MTTIRLGLVCFDDTGVRSVVPIALNPARIVYAYPAPDNDGETILVLDHDVSRRVIGSLDEVAALLAGRVTANGSQ